MSRRSPGAGTVDQLPSGRWRARIPLADGSRKSLGTFDGEDEAYQVLEAMAERLAGGSSAAVGGITLRAWGSRWFAEREISGDVRAVAVERNRWETHVEKAPFIDWPVASIAPVNGAEWVAELRQKFVATPHMGERERRRISRKTIKEIVSLLRLCLDGAIAIGLIRENPLARIKIKRQRRTHEPWTYLLPGEQDALKRCDAIPEPDGLLIRFALLTGLRLGEMFNAKLEDLHVDDRRPHLIVRYGSKDDATKSDRVRRVYLFEEAVLIARRWLAILPKYTASRRYRNGRNPHGLLFPGPRGARRPKGKHLHTTLMIDGKPRKVDRFKRYLDAAGIVAEKRHDRQPVRWHDLRHSCASSLVAGWWGRRWTLEEVKEHLGHSSITITQRYAHLAESALQVAAAGTGGIGSGGGESAKVTQRSHAMQPHNIATKPQGLLTRRSRVRVPVDPPNKNNRLADDDAARRDLQRDLQGDPSGKTRLAVVDGGGNQEAAAALALAGQQVRASSLLWDVDEVTAIKGSEGGLR